ncbi:MAG TPA: dephospho-CoA kinase [Gemmatimonadaceae bacterium]|nr:dephospho-CoA kinase [Gemmatimonadaceae bacterium]
MAQITGISPMLVVGLTGNIASGKSTVARALAARGVTVIDADVLARAAVGPGSAALSRIVTRWGPALLGADGALDRAALRRHVFGHPAELAALNAIVHPEVARRRDALLDAARTRGERIVVCDIPLLFEAGLTGEVDVVVLVDAPAAVRLERLRRDRALSEEDAQAMIAAQLPAEAKRPGADFVIENAGSREALAARVDDVWRAIEARAGVTSA